jgi:LacI family transcriptional regulator
MKGYIQALTDNGLPVDESLIIKCVNDDKQDFEMIKELLLKQKPDGIFAAVEQYALGVYGVCRQLNLAIPKDVKVICFSNLKTASFLNPSLTTITQPAFEIGKEAAAILFKALDKKSFQLKDENIVIKSMLVQRESTANQLL